MEESPFILDFMVELPETVIIENNSQVNDCITGNVGCDDD